MEANNLIARLKADGSSKDACDLDVVYHEYKTVLSNLGAKDRGSFSLNVLCTLCRNLEKVPSWASQVDYKDLLTLTVDCVREARSLDRAQSVKTLACICHIHRYVARQNAATPPELILKLSYMPFETETILNEYCKTYWNIIVDRICYIEKLKTGKRAIIKLLHKLTEDVVKVIKNYDTVQFTTQLLTFLLKKLHFLYNDYPSDLNNVYGKIFEVLTTKNDLKLFKKLPENESMDLYRKLSDCIYVVAENSSKIHFEGKILTTVLRTCMTMLCHRSDIVHCFQTVYLNTFFCIINETNLTITESIINSLLLSCQTTEKVYKNAMKNTYPYINQFLRLYIEYLVTNNERNNWNNCFTDAIQVSCLKLMLLLAKKLTSCEQLLKCDDCRVKSGLHDVLRLTFLIKHFISISHTQGIDLTNILPVYFEVIEEQQSILQQLGKLGCNSYEKCYKKLQADIHNTAILLNKSQNFEISIKLFDLYLRNEIIHFKNETDMKNISRAFYNKSICELDCKVYEDALTDAFMSLIFGCPESLKTEKHMSLAMDVKAKALKAKDDDGQDELQLTSVLGACKKAIEESKYGNLKPFFYNLKFSELLKHEFSMYAKLWPSIIPVAGVWRSLHDLSRNNYPWIKVEEKTLPLLFEVILETPTAVRSILSEYYAAIVRDLLKTLQEKRAMTADDRILHASLLFLNAEYDLADASQKYGWKATEPSMDPDQVQCIRTLRQEHSAVSSALRAVHLWSRVLGELDTVTTRSLVHSLRLCQVFVAQLLHLNKTVQGLQLAHICCAVARFIHEPEIYLRNAGVLISHADKPSRELLDIITTAKRYWAEVYNNKGGIETALVYICDCAIFYARTGELGTAARLVQSAQARVLSTQEAYTDVNLDLAIGRLLEAQMELCKDGGLSTLSAVNLTQRHYLSAANSATKWCCRRLRSLTLKRHITSAGVLAARVSSSLVSWRRARCSAAVSLPGAAAEQQAALFAAVVNCCVTGDAQTKIDNRLKHILGLQPNDIQPFSSTTATKTEQIFTPKQELETMRDHMAFQKQTSPSIINFAVPGFKMPEFLYHNKSCDCYACESPMCLILSCFTSGLEAATFYRSKEFDIAANYFEGTLKSFDLVERKLQHIFEEYTKHFETYIADMVKNTCQIEFKMVFVEVLIEAAFFELSKGDMKNADEKIVRIHELIQDCKLETYLRNKVMNLMTVTARLRKEIKKPTQTGLEIEFESLKLSPNVEPPKTPEAKVIQPPKLTKIVVKDEEILNTKRRVIKLNLDEASFDETERTKKRVSKRMQFKIPVPVTSKPVLETLTPRPNPDIVVTKTESIFDFATPKPKDTTCNDFFTPSETPDQFFTPMTSIKTYAKKTLRQNIVKNLEQEFLTPNAKENIPVEKSRIARKSKIETGSVKSLKDKKSLKRATSPGKLDKKVEDRKPTRSTRLRKPVRFSVDEDDK